jgi:hypothetical protein
VKHYNNQLAEVQNALEKFNIVFINPKLEHINRCLEAASRYDDRSLATISFSADILLPGLACLIIGMGFVAIAGVAVLSGPAVAAGN